MALLQALELQAQQMLDQEVRDCVVGSVGLGQGIWKDLVWVIIMSVTWQLSRDMEIYRQEHCVVVESRIEAAGRCLSESAELSYTATVFIIFLLRHEGP